MTIYVKNFNLNERYLIISFRLIALLIRNNLDKKLYTKVSAPLFKEAIKNEFQDLNNREKAILTKVLSNKFGYKKKKDGKLNFYRFTYNIFK